MRARGRRGTVDMGQRRRHEVGGAGSSELTLRRQRYAKFPDRGELSLDQLEANTSPGHSGKGAPGEHPSHGERRRARDVPMSAAGGRGDRPRGVGPLLDSPYGAGELVGAHR